MKKFFMCCAMMAAMSGAAMAQYQIGNSDFETDWTDNNEPGNGWYSFVSASTDGLNSFIAGIAKSTSKGTTTKVSGRNGGSAVQLQSKDLSLAKANGNLTTGKINMGDTSPSNSKNYNYTNKGTENSCQLIGRPDALEYWAKFTKGQGSNDNNGRCHALIHGDYNYKDPYESDENKSKYLIAEATIYVTPCSDWVKFSGEFSYTGVTSSTAYLLATFTTNETPGASYDDYFVIDDIKLIYYSQLKSLTVDGVSVPNFDKDTYDYTVDSYYTEGVTNVVAVDNTKAGVATVASSYNAETGKYTIVVTNQEGTESHTYTIQFAKKGDVNGDGNVTIADVTALVNIILGKDEKNGVADVNGDGPVTIADVTALVNIILGK